MHCAMFCLRGIENQRRAKRSFDLHKVSPWIDLVQYDAPLTLRQPITIVDAILNFVLTYPLNFSCITEELGNLSRKPPLEHEQENC